MGLLIRSSLFAVVAVLVFGAVVIAQEQLKYRNVTVREALQLIESVDSLVVLDVRTKEEFKGQLGHLQDAVLIPIQELERRIHELDGYKSKEILVYCRTGRRSVQACEILSAKGFKVYNLLGGIVDWRKLEEKQKKD